MKKVLLFTGAVLCSSLLFAQENRMGELRLKNGGTIKGEVVERDEDGNTSIETADGVIYEYEAKEIKSFRFIKRGLERRRGYIGMSAGPAFPVGDFAKANNGGADVGFNFCVLNFGYLFNDYFGITATFFGGEHGFEYRGDDDYAPWSFGGVSVGPLISFPVTRRFEIDLRPMLGVCGTSTPDLYAYDEYDYATSLSFHGNLMFRYHVGRKVSILLGGEYFFTRADFNDYDFRQNISAVSVNAGLAIRFR